MKKRKGFSSGEQNSLTEKKKQKKQKNLFKNEQKEKTCEIQN